MTASRSPGGRRPSAPWLGASNLARIGSYELSDFLYNQLLLAANAERATCRSYGPRGRLVVKIETVVGELQAAGYHVLSSDDDARAHVLVSARGYIQVDSRASIPLYLGTLDANELTRMREHFPFWVRRTVRRGAFYMLQNQPGLGLAILPMGSVGCPLRRDNYAASVLDAYDHALVDLEAECPCGRLVLISGPPGTGKTHLVRGMLAAAERARVVLVQASDVERLLEAEPLTALCSFSRGTAKGRPIVLVIEDSDECLLPRGTDNLSKVSALLNMSDGLIGAALDLRIIATTNARTVEIDPAIMRVGRICRRIDVGPLERDEARRVLAGLLGGREPSGEWSRATLAEVYARARECGRDARSIPSTVAT